MNNNYRLLYRKRKSQLFPILFVIAVFIVTWQVLLPQWDDIGKTRALVNDLKQTVQAKRDNVRILSSMEDSVVEDAFDIAATALPIKKDIILIFTQLEQVSARSNVGLGGFSIKVGGVYSKDPSKREDGPSIDGVPYLNIMVNASGTTDSLQSFAEELYKSIPLTEINSVDLTERDGRFDVNFYYLPIIAGSDDSDKSVIVPLTESEMEEIDNLRTWQ